MNKNLFISIVLGIDALTIGAFGTAAYESGRPIVGVVFLFVLVILSGIAFGFVLNQDEDKSMPKISPTIYTRMGINVMKKTMKMLEEECANDNPCPDGLCVLLKMGLSRELNIDYNCVTETQMFMVFPFFSYSNAKMYGSAVYPEKAYWWDRDDILPRIEFLKTMIRWQEEL